MKYIISILRAWCALTLLIAVAFLTAHTANAYQVSPLHHYLEFTGKKAISSLTISNTHDFPLTVELTIERREMSGGIVQQDVPADDNFLIFPPQAIIQPGKKQRVQIRYVGEPLDHSELFRLIVTQVPVKLNEENTAKVNVSYNFVSAVYVAPKGAKVDLYIESITPSPQNGYDINIKNNGNYHALLPAFIWTASDGSQKHIIDLSQIAIGEEPFIEPDGARILNIPQKAMGQLNLISSLVIVPADKQGQHSR